LCRVALPLVVHPGILDSHIRALQLTCALLDALRAPQLSLVTAGASLIELAPPAAMGGGVPGQWRDRGSPCDPPPTHADFALPRRQCGSSHFLHHSSQHAPLALADAPPRPRDERSQPALPPELGRRRGRLAVHLAVSVKGGPSGVRDRGRIGADALTRGRVDCLALRKCTHQADYQRRHAKTREQSLARLATRCRARSSSSAAK
jgi:hypothetical protein